MTKVRTMLMQDEEIFKNDKKGRTSQPNTGLAAQGEHIYAII